MGGAYISRSVSLRENGLWESHLHAFVHALSVDSFLYEVRINVVKALANERPEGRGGRGGWSGRERSGNQNLNVTF